MKMLTAKYICRKCGLEESVDVRERSQTEDIVNYVHHCGNKCGEDHMIRSPLCPARQVDLMVPFSQNGIVFAGPELTKEQREAIDNQLNREGGSHD